MISGNRMVKGAGRPSQKPPQQQPLKPATIHTISSLPSGFPDTQLSAGYEVMKPKQQNLRRVSPSLRSDEQNKAIKPAARNSKSVAPNPPAKAQFQSIARHGMKIGSTVLGKAKWQCKVCKQVNTVQETSCLRCESEKGELKQKN